MSIQFPSIDTNAAVSHGTPLYQKYARAAPRGVYEGFLKRAIDILAVVMSLPIVLLPIAVMALLVAMNGARPFYGQKRLGRNGEVFTMWKIRTMEHDADKKLQAYLSQNQEAQAEWDTDQKLKYDPRITPIGRILRKFSLDELPQLLNVLNGSMSLVGPRPMLPEQQELYPGYKYYALRPGLTGPWQVSRRNDCKFGDRAAYDNTYYDTLSLKTDVSLVLSTPLVMLRGTGY